MLSEGTGAEAGDGLATGKVSVFTTKRAARGWTVDGAEGKARVLTGWL